jgi:hypothetical protein
VAEGERNFISAPDMSNDLENKILSNQKENIDSE